MLVTAAFPSSSVVYQFMAAVSMLLGPPLHFYRRHWDFLTLQTLTCVAVYQQLDRLEEENTGLKGAGGAS